MVQCSRSLPVLLTRLRQELIFVQRLDGLLKLMILEIEQVLPSVNTAHHRQGVHGGIDKQCIALLPTLNAIALLLQHLLFFH